MNHVHTLGAAALLTLAGGGAFANEPRTRETVIAELREAIRTGDIVTGYSGLKLNEISPGSYPPKPQVQGKTRAAVLAEFAEARRTGDLMSEVSGLKLRERFPGRYPPARIPVAEAVPATAATP